jgi:TonB-dependent starch-binding outer membrane protein SusC
LLLMSVCFIAHPLLAQDRTITGTIKDGNGVPVAGASIMVGGKYGGVTAAADGSYSIKIPQSVKSFTVSSVGFDAQYVTIGAGNKVDVVLIVADKMLSEVVVTGVGTATSKRKLAFAVEGLSEKDLPKIPGGSIDRALIGRIAGAQITSTSGQPGQQANIILRGINSLGTTQPMIMVDGVQVNSGGNTNGSGVNISSRLSDLDLSNVERVEVVQGAAAATIYGAQGANGVIQIFTKKGRTGKTKITVNTSAAIDEALTGNLRLANNHFNRTDAAGFMVDAANVKLTKDAYGKWGTPVQVIAGAINNKPYLEPTYDNLDASLNQALTTTHSVNISGGKDKSDFSLNISHLDQESVINGKYKRSNLTLNLGTELFKNFKMRSITQVVYSDNQTGGITGSNDVNSALGNIINTPRYINLQERNSFGNFSSNPTGTNSVNPFYDFDNRTYRAKNTRVVQNFNFNYKMNRFVELDYKIGIDNYRYDYDNFIKNQRQIVGPGAAGINPLDGRITYDRDNETFINSLVSVFVKTDFEKDFGWNVPIQTSTQLAYDWRRRNYKNEFAQGTGFLLFPPFNMTTAQTKNANDYVEKFLTFGYLVNQRFDYANLAGVSGGFRTDWASTFGEGKEAFFFPRADAYFRPSELFQSNVLADWKVRAAYGEAGIQPGTWSRQVTLAVANIGNSGTLSNPNTVSNPALKVEKSKELEIGTDILVKPGFSSNWLTRIAISGTYWTRDGVDVIRGIDQPTSVGSVVTLTNAIDLSSDGFQLSVDADIVKSNKFKWDFGLRYGQQKTMVERIQGGNDIILGGNGAGQFFLRQGERIGAFFGNIPVTALDQTTSKGVLIIPAANLANHEIVNGYAVNKTTRQVVFSPESGYLGDPTPKFNMSFLNTFTIMNDLSVFVQWDWMKGNDTYNQTKQWLYRDFIHSDFDNPVNINGDNKAWVDYYNSLYRTNNTNGHFVENGSFLRLRDVTMTYNFTNLLKKTKVGNAFENAQLFVSGRNLATITDYTGMDPEAAASFNNPLRRGLDLYSFPNSRTFQVGLNLGF